MDINSKLYFYYTILIFGLAISLQVKISKKLVLNTPKIVKKNKNF